MYSIKSIFLIGLVTLTACNSSSKDSEDTGFDLGTADAGTANDGDADGSGDDVGVEQWTVVQHMMVVTRAKRQSR